VSRSALNIVSGSLSKAAGDKLCLFDMTECFDATPLTKKHHKSYNAFLFNEGLLGFLQVKCAQLRTNCLPTKARLSRGRSGQDLNALNCRGQCGRMETVEHIMQS